MRVRMRMIPLVGWRRRDASSAGSKAALLREVLRPAPFEERALRELASCLAEVVVPAGVVLARQGQPSRQLGLLVEGTATLSRGGQPLTVLGPGDIVGEAAVLGPGPEWATVATRTPTRLLVAGVGDRRGLQDHPALVRQLAGRLRDRLRDALTPPRAARPAAVDRRAAS